MVGMITFIEVGKLAYDDINGIFNELKKLKKDYDLALSHCALDFNRRSTDFSVKCNYNDAEHKMGLFVKKKEELYNKVDAYNRLLRLFDDEDGFYEIERDYLCCSNGDKFIINKNQFDNPDDYGYRW